MERRKIAVVDDDPATVSAMERMLSPLYDVTPVSEPHEILNLLIAGHRFSTIFMDVWMPVNGIALHDSIAELAPDQAKRVVFVSGWGLPDRLKKHLGDREVLRKPASLEEMTAAVERMAPL